jgi:aspartyl/asparaginyl-tRNA synthetase
MQEFTLIKISITVMIIGFTCLLHITNTFDLNEINTLDNKIITEEIKMQGVIEKVHTQEKATFLTITGKKIETINVILFSKENIELHPGNTIELEGTIEEYEGKKQVIAHEIKLT